MPTGSIIFHHPGPVTPGGRSGSQVRPWRLLEAFRESGHEVEAVTGYGAERSRQIERLQTDIKRGRRFDFIYSESRSIPTLLTERHRVPLYPLLDFRFLRDMRRKGIPVGLYYRDVFWRFDMYRDMLPWPARAVTVPLYHYDWWWYRRTVDHLFLPSLRMANHLPSIWPAERVSALPPGTFLPEPLENNQPSRNYDHHVLQMLYVGGVEPPTYDIKPLLATVNAIDNLRLTVCCRSEEWQRMRQYYSSHISSQIEVAHVSGKQLAALYYHSDVFGLIRKPDVYLDFAVPVKVFESLSHGLPILTLSNNESARLIAQDGLGWVVDNLSEAQVLLQHLLQNPQFIRAKQMHVLSERKNHTWRARAQEIQRQLSQYPNRTKT